LPLKMLCCSNTVMNMLWIILLVIIAGNGYIRWYWTVIALYLKSFMELRKQHVVPEDCKPSHEDVYRVLQGPYFS
jgi:hypothetical protein